MAETGQIAVRSIADGATAQIRALIPYADRDEARRIYTELTRIAAELARRHDFQKKER